MPENDFLHLHLLKQYQNIQKYPALFDSLNVLYTIDTQAVSILNVIYMLLI